MPLLAEPGIQARVPRQTLGLKGERRVACHWLLAQNHIPGWYS